VDLTSAAVLAVAAAHGVAAASVLLVSERGDERLDVEALERAEVELGRVGAAALSSRSPRAGRTPPADPVPAPRS
jgi:hypothetical protein